MSSGFCTLDVLEGLGHHTVINDANHESVLSCYAACQRLLIVWEQPPCGNRRSNSLRLLLQCSANEPLASMSSSLIHYFSHASGRTQTPCRSGKSHVVVRYFKLCLYPCLQCSVSSHEMFIQFASPPCFLVCIKR